jgi:hypothetical protein
MPDWRLKTRGGVPRQKQVAGQAVVAVPRNAAFRGRRSAVTGRAEHHSHRVTGVPGATLSPVTSRASSRDCATARRGVGVKGGASRRVCERTLDADEQRRQAISPALAQGCASVPPAGALVTGDVGDIGSANKSGKIRAPSDASLHASFGCTRVSRSVPADSPSTVSMSEASALACSNAKVGLARLPATSLGDREQAGEGKPAWQLPFTLRRHAAIATRVV